MADQDFDVYGDLDEFELEQVVKEKSDAYKKLEEKYDLAIQTIKNLHNDVNVWKKKCHNIEKSFWSLLATSKAEIKRKDVQLDTLRRQRDDIAFRRVKPNNKIEIDRDLHNEKSSATHLNPFRPPSTQHIEETRDLRNKIIDNKKTVNKNDCKQRENSHNQTKVHNIDEKYDNTTKINYSKDSTKSLDQRNPKEENCDKKNNKDLASNNRNVEKKNLKNNYTDKKQYKDSDKNHYTPEKHHHKDDNKSKYHKDNYLRNSKIDREITTPEEPVEFKCNDVDNNSESDTKRICKLSEKNTANNCRESIKLTVTIQNPTKETTSKSTVIKETDEKKENTNLKSETVSTQLNCEKSATAKSLISELMQDLKTSNNNFVPATPVHTNKKSFEDVLFDNMVCGDEALSVVDENQLSNVQKNTNSDQLTCSQHENVEEIFKNSEKSSKESTPLDSYEIQFENSLSLDLELTLKETPLPIAEEIIETLEESVNERENKPVENTDQPLNNSLVEVIVVPEELTPIEYAFQHESVEKPKLIDNVEQNSSNKSATKFYELYLESPVKTIEAINEKNTIIINDDNNQNICHHQMNTNIIEENKNQQKIKEISSNEKLFDHSFETNTVLGKTVNLFKEISNSPKTIHAENDTVVNSKLKEDTVNQKVEVEMSEKPIEKDKFNIAIGNEDDFEITINQKVEESENPTEKDKTNIANENEADFKVTDSQKIEEIGKKSVEKDKSNIPNENETYFEVADIIENTQIERNEENDKIEIINLDQSSESIITPLSMSPNQKETIAATKYLTEMLQTNMPSTSSPLKVRLKLLFGESPQATNKFLNPSSSAYTYNSKKNKNETPKTNENITEDFCKEIVEDNITKLKSNSIKKSKDITGNEVPVIFSDEPETVLNTTGRNKRKTEISPKYENLNVKKLKINLPTDDKEKKILKTPCPEDTKYELNTKKPTRHYKRSHSNRDIQIGNVAQELNNSVQLKSQSEVISKKLKESISIEDSKMSLHENVDNLVNDNCLQETNEIVDNDFKLENFTNTENIVRTSETEMNDEKSINIINTINISRKKRRNREQRTKCPKIEQDESLKKPENLNSGNSNDKSAQEIAKLSQILPQTVERKESIKNFIIPKLNKVSSKTKDSPVEKNLLKNFKIPKLNKNSKKTKDKVENTNCIAEDNKENPQINEKIKMNEKLNTICDNLSTDKISSKKVSKTEKFNKNFENEFNSTPKQNNIPISKVLSKNDEELFDCIFKSPLQISADNNSFEQETLAGNSENSKFNQVEEDFQKLFGKSAQSSPVIMSPPISSNNENYPIDNPEIGNFLTSKIDKHEDSEKNIANNSTSSMDDSSILRKTLSTSTTVYQMEYNEKEGITNWTITRKKGKKKKKSIN